MRYEIKSTYGLRLYSGSKPYKKVNNNGYTILTQDEDLLAQLKENDKQRDGDIIDWCVFKPSRAVLVDDQENHFACTGATPGYTIQLTKIIQQVKYAVILCVERELSIVGTANTYQEAHEIMKRNFYDFHKAQHFTKKELEVYKDEWVIGDYIARSTVNDDLPADWKIEAIYV